MQAAEVSQQDPDLRSVIGKRPILVDARKVSDGGIGVYTQNLIADLVARDIPLAVLGNPDALENFRWYRQIRVLDERARPYSVDEFFSLSRRVPFQEYSLFHCPHYTLPFRVPIPSIITIHDLIHLTHPERAYYPFAAWGMIASALMRADGVLTVSQAAALDIKRYFPAFVRRATALTVVPNRLADQFREDSIPKTLDSERFLFLSVSQPKPHKGVLDLLKAYVAAKDQAEALVARGQLSRTALSTELLIGGFGAERLAANPLYKPYLENRSDVRVLGALSSAELKSYYAGARAVIVPSRAEGFGFPIIEAHSQGTPVLMRPVPALLELRTGSDVVANSLSPEALTESLLTVLGSEKNPVDVASLRSHARGYSPERFIEPILELYRGVILQQRA